MKIQNENTKSQLTKKTEIQGKFSEKNRKCHTFEYVDALFDESLNKNIAPVIQSLNDKTMESKSSTTIDAKLK